MNLKTEEDRELSSDPWPLATRNELWKEPTENYII